MKKVNTGLISGCALLIALTMMTWASLANAQQAGISNEGLNLLLDQVRQLQTEVQQLRALSDEQGYALRQLQRESLDRYTNTDNRLSSLENGQPPGAGISTTPIDSTALPSVAAPDYTQPAVVSPTTPAAGSFGNPAPAVTSNRPGLQAAVLSEQQMYQMAYDSVINSNFNRSVAEFDQYLSSYPNGRFVANAHYWKGQAYLYLSRYSEARDAYQTIINQYAQSTKLPDAMYGLAQAYEGLGDTVQARSLLTEIIRRYPNTGVANLSDTRLMSLD